VGVAVCILVSFAAANRKRAFVWSERNAREPLAREWIDKVT
jgi:hypothetical protein